MAFGIRIVIHILGENLKKSLLMWYAKIVETQNGHCMIRKNEYIGSL